MDAPSFVKKKTKTVGYDTFFCEGGFNINFLISTQAYDISFPNSFSKANILQCVL